MGTSLWQQQQFGSLAEEFARAIPVAVRKAHERAMAAQVAAEMREQEAYGHTMKVQKHRQIVAAVSDLPGVEPVPLKGFSYGLVRVVSTGVVLFPWRYSTIPCHIKDVKMKVSTLKQALVLDDTTRDMQISIDTMHLTAEQMEAEAEALREVSRQLHDWSKIIIIGFASNSRGLFSLNWGEACVTDAAGTLKWHALESLPVVGPGGSESVGGATAAGPSRTPLRPVGGASPAALSPRFDDAAPDEDDFGITPRSPLDGEPSQEPTPPLQGTGTSEPGADE